uniref:Uncharacterized protein n=1 Tax=Moniliophthora roreri TaxID=221103 RepID=A0A0W0FR97_MONRR
MGEKIKDWEQIGTSRHRPLAASLLAL